MNKRASFIANEQGFTLTEIIAVLVVLGILAAVAVPKYMNLQDEARNNAAEGAIAEVKSRLTVGYAQYVLKNSSEPATVADICGTNGVNDPDILPTDGDGEVNVGDDFTVTIEAGGTDDKGATITVTHVQPDEDDASVGQLDPAVSVTWEMP